MYHQVETPQIALCALSQQLVGILTEHLHIHQTLGVPVVEVGDRLAVVVLGADKAALAVLLQHQIVAHIVGPVGESEACVEDVLTPAPLVKASGHRDSAAGSVAVDLGGHIVVFEGFRAVCSSSSVVGTASPSSSSQRLLIMENCGMVKML